MARRSANPTQSFVKRLFEAAAKLGASVRVEIHPDDTTVVTTTTAPMLPALDEGGATDLERWMRKHHANPA
jgi:hypothetical protein